MEVLEAFLPGEPARLNELRLMLVSNGLFHWTQLGKVKDLRSLLGVERFTDVEVDALLELQSNGRQAPQSPRAACAVACQAQVIVQAVATGSMDGVPANLTLSSAAKGKGPMAAAKSLKLAALRPEERAQWAETV